MFFYCIVVKNCDFQKQIVVPLEAKQNNSRNHTLPLFSKSDFKAKLKTKDDWLFIKRDNSYLYDFFPSVLYCKRGEDILPTFTIWRTQLLHASSAKTLPLSFSHILPRTSRAPPYTIATSSSLSSSSSSSLSSYSARSLKTSSRISSTLNLSTSSSFVILRTGPQSLGQNQKADREWTGSWANASSLAHPPTHR